MAAADEHAQEDEEIAEEHQQAGGERPLLALDGLVEPDIHGLEAGRDGDDAQAGEDAEQAQHDAEGATPAPVAEDGKKEVQ